MGESKRLIVGLDVALKGRNSDSSMADAVKGSFVLSEVGAEMPRSEPAPS